MSRSRRHHAGTVLNISWASARERIVQFLVASLQDIMAQERFLRILPGQEILFSMKNWLSQSCFLWNKRY